MSISPELMFAILSMDSYNRGYDPGIVGLGGEGSLLGTAIVKKDALQLLDEGAAQAAGFYAVAYDWNGKTVISYRGTDDFTLDPAFGWPVAIGGPGAEQGKLAASFYRSVVGDDNMFTSDALITGHSLGGGLAGLVGAVYGQKAVLFDPMAFELAADHVYENYFRTDGSYLQALVDAYYGTTSPQPIDKSEISGFHVDGEGLSGMASWFGTELDDVTLGSGLDLGLGPLDRHSISLLILLQHAKENQSTFGLNWTSISNSLMNSLYDDQLGRVLS